MPINHDVKMTMKAEDIMHVLRDGIAVLPGGRCRAGQAVVVCPSREQVVNQDHLRNVFLYLFEVAAKEAREKGFLVVIDMRGKQTWNNVRNILKVLNNIASSTIKIHVFIIKPDKFWEKQKAQMSLGTYSFEVEMISFESLIKIIDSSQLPKSVGGTYPYDHDEWLELRIDLEKWIWNITEVMEKLESVRREICDGEQPIDVETANVALKKSQNAKKNIFNIPVDGIEADGNKIANRILHPPNGFKNPDLMATTPYISNLTDSLRLLKGEVHKHWDTRQEELVKVYNQKLFECDADKMIDHLRPYKETFVRSMGDVGGCVADVSSLTAEFQSFEEAVLRMEVSVQQVFDQVRRLRTNGARTHNIEHVAEKLAKEWHLVKELIERRKTILQNAKKFFTSAQCYFAEVPRWTAQPGVNPDEVLFNQECLEIAIRKHDAFWAHVEEVYAQAYEDALNLMKALKEAESEDNVAKEHSSRLQRAHKQLMERWKERQVLLHQMLAMIAFETDVKLVVDWLEQHGEPYLRRNINIGENVNQAKTFQRNHTSFQRVAANTYNNVEKLGQVYQDVTNSGSNICDVEKMNALMTDLQAKIKKFTTIEQLREQLLRQSVLFHTHYKELTDWYRKMTEKYRDRRIDLTVQVCDDNKERFVLEADETGQAYAVTILEGKTVIDTMHKSTNLIGIDYTASIAHIQLLIADIEEKNKLISAEWGPRRTLLHIASKFAMFEHNKFEVLEQIQGWEEDMREMMESPSFHEKADNVMPYHIENQEKVREAIMSIQKAAHELQQALHGQKLMDLRDKRDRVVLEVIREHLQELQISEKRVMRYANETSARIEAVREVCELRAIAKGVCNLIERQLDELPNLGTIPHDYNETVHMQDKLRAFRDTAQNLLKDPYEAFVVRFRELMENRLANRDEVVRLNEMIQTKYRRLMALCEERNKLLKSAHGCYKTYETAVLPILNQLESEYHSPSVTDWCSGCTSTVHQERAAYVADLLSKHMDYKERFGKGCTYALRNGDFLLRYIKRASVSPSERKRHENKIADMKTNIRERQSNILELWLQKKALLQGCQTYIFIEASAKDLLDFMNGEGNEKLKQFEKRGRGELNEEDDEFAKFKSEVKQKKTDIQTFLMLCTDETLSRGVHGEEIERCIEKVKENFNRFSRRVGDCEVVLRGENGGPQKDEFSLDRHSDTAIFNEKTISEQRAENRKMLEPMRELIQSERDYIKDLERCVNIYVKEFDQAKENGSIPSLPKYDIFGNIEKIFQFHNDKLLHELVKYETQPEAVGASFTVWIDLLNELYTEYCVNKEQKNYMLATPDALTFFTGIREKHGLEINNEIASLLIKPVQRITRYRLLIEQLLKNCNDRADDLKEAYEVVCSVPRKVNDLIHFNCLDLKECKIDELGPFVTQDTLTVWEPRAYFKGRGKERQVFLFDLSIVFAKRFEISPKNFKYVIKGKPLPLSEVSIVEHVEGDSCRFGLRVGTVSSNDNRTDLKASSENTKVKWVLKIRELTTGMLPLGLGVSPALSVGTLSTARSVSVRSGASTSSGGGAENRQSQDVDSLLHHRYSVHSCDSEQSSEVWIVTADFDGHAEGHLKVHKGDRVEIVEDQATDCAEYLQVVLCDQPTKQGLVPASIIAPPESGSVPDRPDDTNASGSSVSKRKSLRRIFANSSKATSSSSNNNSSPATRQSTSTSSPVVTANGHTAESSTAPAAIGVLSSGESSSSTVPAAATSTTPTASTPTHTAAPSTTAPVVIAEEEKVEDCLPPPMENITINNSMDEKDQNDESVAASEEPEVPEKAEKTPEEIARFKRSYVLMELVETEQDYVKDLTSVVEGYIGNLEKMDLPADLVGKDKIIFANIAQILDFHKTYFLKEIEKSLTDYNAAGAAFHKYEKRLSNLYVKYCQNKPKSDYLLAQDDFEGFFAETKASLGHKVALCDLLIKPVQRIMKYQLLLKDILKFTDRAKDNTDMLKKGLAVMHRVPKACDDFMQVGRLQNFDGNLNAQGNLIHQGTLQIIESVAGNQQKPKDRRIFLFEQSAIIADHIPPKKEFGNPLYIFKNQIMVNKMIFEPNVPDDPLRFVIKSSDPTQPTAFIAQAQTQEEKDQWNQKVSEQLDQQKRLLAALMDPKKYMGDGDDVSGAVGNMNLGASTSNDKNKPSCSAAKSSANASKKPAESPKKEKSKSLFSFGKKPAKSPTSPPPVDKK